MLFVSRREVGIFLYLLRAQCNARWLRCCEPAVDYCRDGMYERDVLFCLFFFFCVSLNCTRKRLPLLFILFFFLSFYAYVNRFFFSVRYTVR
uniref:Uncharacterized protein n=1 Tax=Ixodes ricinus TaxID=34613 RepID=A0A147BVK0_IXORI